MSKIAMNVIRLEQLQSSKGWSDSELSRQSGISRTQLWRAKLDPKDARHSLGQDVINKILGTFPNVRFEELFFLTQVCQKRNTDESGQKAN